MDFFLRIGGISKSSFSSPFSAVVGGVVVMVVATTITSSCVEYFDYMTHARQRFLLRVFVVDKKKKTVVTPFCEKVSSSIDRRLLSVCRLSLLIRFCVCVKTYISRKQYKKLINDYLEDNNTAIVELA